MKTFEIPRNLIKPPKDLKLLTPRKSIFKLINNPHAFNCTDHFSQVHKRKYHAFGSIHFNINNPGIIY